jgi:hypothetical protein
MEQEELTSPPTQQKMLKAQSLNVEEGTVGLHHIEHLISLDEEGTSQDNFSSSSLDFDSPRTSATSCNTSPSSTTTSGPPEWDELVEAFLGDRDQDNDLRYVSCKNFCNIVMNHLPFRCK